LVQVLAARHKHNITMLERHEIEQYFWDDRTLLHLSEQVQGFENPCCLCAPLLGRELAQHGQKCCVLDIDERFADVPGWARFDLYRPQWRPDEFGLIVCDPPFWKVSLSQLFGAISILAHHNPAQPLLISYPKRRSFNICGTFSRFGLQPLAGDQWRAGYRTIPERDRERDGVIFFSNVERWIMPDE